MTLNPPKLTSNLSEKSKNEESLTHLNFRPLTPQTIEGTSVELYLNAITYAINRKDIKNIALTGSYGSGKSSILKTYEERNPENRYLNISLASFNKRDSEEENSPSHNNNDHENLERLLELSILQQIFYHVDYNAIPDSRFKRIRSLSNMDLSVFAASALIWLVSSCYLFFPNILNFSTLKRVNAEMLTLLFGIIFFLGFARVLMHLRRVYNNSKLNKLNIQSGEVELDKDIDQSILNKHLDELIYFFEVNDFDIVIIEDLDRFKNTEIFSKLRELNLLINNSQQVSRSVRFIYAIKDDMFTDDSRTKFFDFVIPVIPVVDPTNASDILKNSFDMMGNTLCPSEDFLKDVASFITDMRFLNNVFNEFLVYREMLSPTLLPNNLFSIILYKNFYPEDFIELQKGRGKLYSIIHSRSSIIRDIEKDIDLKIEEIKKRIDTLDSELLEDENELRAVYISAIQREQPRSAGIVLKNLSYSFGDFYDPEKFEKLMEVSEINYRVLNQDIATNYSHLSTVHGKPFTVIEKKVNSKLSYVERLEIIRNESPLTKLRDEQKKLNLKKKEIRNWELKKLLSHSSSFLKREPHKDKLVVYFLTTGFIDENYSSYISKFYPGNLSFSDNEYYQSILAGLKKDFSYPLERKLNTLSKIAPRFFQTPLVFNVDLIDCLLENKEDFSTRLNFIINQFQAEDETALDFLDCYLSSGSQPLELLRLLYSEWKNLWNYIEIESNFEDNRIEDYVRLLLNAVDPSDLSRDNSGFVDYIEFKKDFLSVVREVPKTRISLFLKTVSLAFHHLQMPEEDDLKTLELIVQLRRYKLNEHNLGTILKALSPHELLNPDFANFRYSSITKSNLPDLKEHVENELPSFVETVLLKLETIIEEQKGITSLLNNEDLEKTIREEIIKKLGVKLVDISQIKSLYFQGLLLIHSKAEPTWANVINHYEANDRKISSALVPFLNNKENFQSLAQSNVPQSKLILSLSSSFIQEDTLELESYTSLVTALFKNPYSNENLESLSLEKITWLIEKKKLALTQSNIAGLRINYPGYQLKLIEENQSEFTRQYSKFELNKDELIGLLSLPKANDSLKFKIISENTEILKSLDSRLLTDVIWLLNTKTTINLNPDQIKEIVVKSGTLDESIKLINKYSHQLKAADIREIISVLPGKVTRILEKGRWLLFDSTPSLVAFSLLLEEREIATCSKLNGKIRITGKGK